MKTFLVSILFLFGLSVNTFGQIGSCETPGTIIVNSVPCNRNSDFVGFFRLPSEENADSIQPSFYDSYKIKPALESWIKFKANSENMACQVGDSKDFSIYVFADSCLQNQKLTAFSSYKIYYDYFNGQPSVSPTISIENLTIGQYYHIKFSTPFISQTGLSICLYPLPETGSKIISTSSGGDFFSPTTWLQNRVPCPLDTVVIADGSSVTFRAPQGTLVPLSYSYKGLMVGQGGIARARLIMNNSQTSRIFLFGDFTIFSGDSIIGSPTSFVVDDFLLYGNFRNDGVFQYLRSNGLGFLSIAKPRLYFLGNRRQTAEGTGSYLGCGLPHIYVDNPSGVDWRIQWPVKGVLFLKRGLFDNSSVDLSFSFDRSVPNGDAANPGLAVAGGRLVKKLGAATLRIPTFERSSIATLAFLSDRTQRPTASLNLSDYLPDTVSVWLAEFSAGSSTSIEFNRSFRCSLLSHLSGILAGRQSDTLSSHEYGFPVVTSPSFHSTFGYHRASRREGSPSNITWYPKAWINGRPRGHRLSKLYLNTPDTFAITTRLLGLAPSGPILAPGTFLIGDHILEIRANRRLNDSTRLEMEHHPEDNLPGLPEQWRLIQAPTPNGPWRTLETTLVSFLMRTRMPINLENGNYFAFGSVGNANDANLTRVMRPWYGLFNCPGQIVRPFNLLVRNGGVAPISSIKGGVLINGVEYSQTFVPGNGLRAPIVPGRTDTLRVPIPSLPFGTYAMRFFVNMANDAQAGNDSISYNFNIRPHNLGDLLDFDTVNISSVNYNPFLEAGRPLIEGWYQSTYDTASLRFAANSFFVDQQRGTKFLRTWNMARNGYVEFRTRPFGPLVQNAHFNIDMSVLGTILRASDTIYLDASDDCGQTYRRLETITRINESQYLSTLFVDEIQPPPTRRYLLPFPEGSFVHARLLYKWPEGLQFFQISADNVWVGVPTGLTNESKQQNKLHVWPNPANDVLHVLLPAGETLSSVFISDLHGRVSSASLDKGKIDIRNLGSGIYLIRFTTDKQVYYHKLVKE